MTATPPSIAALLASTVERCGDRVAIVDGDHRRTWRELAEDVHRRADALRACGLTRGDGLALVLGNDHQFVTTFLAAQTIGAMAVPLNPLFNAEEIGQHLAATTVRGIVSDAALAPAVRDPSTGDTIGEGPWVVDVGGLDETGPAPGHANGDRVGPDDAALFAYSSGSTGTPKGMIRTNANLVAEAEQFGATAELSEGDVILAVVALFHAHGLGNCLLAAVHSGAALVLVSRFERDAVLEAIEHEGVSVFPGVPFIFHTLAETRRAERADLRTLRLCISAGAPLTAETAALFLARFGVPVRQLYGCSEAGSVTINLEPEPLAHPTSVGRPMHGIDLVVVDEDGTPRPPGKSGELVFRSPALTAGYVGGDPAGNDVFRDGWFHTGDVGHLDDEGNLFVTGRTKLFISTSGYKVDPFEVEAVLREQPGVADVVVVGVKGDAGEELVKAVVVADPTVTDPDRLPERLTAACRARLSAFKVPRIVELRDEIPRSPLGKILRKYLV